MKVCHKRLQKEYLSLKKQPVENIEALPNDRNILEWHYVVRGPKGSVYEGGVYHGKLIFTEEYPYKPPSIIMITRSGRFKTNTRLCLSMSDFHPETWNPLWSVGSILSGLLSFMLDTTPTLGSIETSDKIKKELALRSMEENIRNDYFCRFFPAFVQEYKNKKKASKKKNQPGGSNPDESNKSILPNSNGDKKKTRSTEAKSVAGSAETSATVGNNNTKENKTDNTGTPAGDAELEHERGISCRTVILAFIVLTIAVLLPLYMG
eukprot:CAMPEP_0204823532 /NCGR_PEP_ID=MMETSP1346-20131115/1611_1 /ASSEMBLY_ACC=CAM_ASM_000771 /TAXON_ID=215587 /ORGANISM="Aplanochytrium stocchinoi, Strain GSBS06" /LENGTH=263 /DNA_ID=CAMNT_0051950213 /DNA_START=89 /DNA_END=880 /DNA_ORIENTATION=-